MGAGNEVPIEVHGQSVGAGETPPQGHQHPSGAQGHRPGRGRRTVLARPAGYSQLVHDSLSLGRTLQIGRALSHQLLTHPRVESHIPTIIHFLD